MAFPLLALLLRPVYWFVSRVLFDMRVVGKENILAGPALLVGNHVSLVDGVLLHAAAWPRSVHIVSVDSVEQAKAAVQAGDLVCVFPENGVSRNGNMQPFPRELERLSKSVAAPIVPLAMVNLWGSIFSYRGGRIIWKWPESLRRKVAVCFGTPLAPTSDAPAVRRAVQRIAAWCHRHGNHWSVPVHRKFVRAAARHPFRSCYVDAMNQRELNAGKALAGAIVLRNWLRPRLGPEAMVGLWLPSSVGGALANVALAFLGKTTVNLNYTSSADSLRSAVRQTGIRQILTSRLFVRKVPLEIPSHEGPADGDKVQLVYLEDALQSIKNWRRVLTFLQVVLLPGWLIERLWLGLGRHHLDDLATIIFSSGSTGEPKGVMLSHRNIAANIESVVSAVDLFSRDRLLGCLPFFHSFGYTVTLWAPLQIGATAVYYPDPRQAKEIGEVCKNYRCTIFLSTATFLRFYQKRSDPDDFKSLRLLICGAEKLPMSLAEQFHSRFGILPLEGYGCTELSPVVSSNVPDRDIAGIRQVGQKPGTIGQPIPMVAVKIVNPESYEELPTGADGLLMVTGANVMVGYFGQPEMTADVIRDEWYATGDMGHVDDDGFVTLTGRLSRFAKIGGEMVPLEKIEEELHAAAGATDRFAAVTAVPDAARGERLVILHTPLLGADARQLCQRLAERHLPNLWLPKERDFYPVPELPLLGSGKLDLKRVKEMAVEKAVK
ncbi:MAG: AMP-binding protein [Gemmataceae bacterium]